MKTRFLALTALAAASFGPSLFGQAAATKVDPAVRHTQMLTRMLTLTADQQTQVQKLLTDEEASVATYQTQLKTLRASLLDAIKANKADLIDTYTFQMSTPRQMEDAVRAKTAASIYALLSADQQAKVNNGVEMLAGMGGRGGPGGPGPMMHRAGRPQ
jgi:Spy/CpxP family protein refolding chaperone